MPRSDASRRHFGLQVSGKMHNDRCDGLGRIVHDVNLLFGHVATVHVVELDVVLISLDIAYHVGILAVEVNNLIDHYTFQRQVIRLRRSIAIEGYLLVEMAQLASVVGSRHREVLAAGNGLAGKVSLCATATCPDVLDDKRRPALVLQVEIDGYRLVVDYLSAIHHIVVCTDFLG